MPIDDNDAELATAVADAADDSGRTVAVAESLTGGTLAAALAAAPEASSWFRGGVVAYAADVKFKVLGVPTGPVVTEECARAMARGVADLLDADVAVAVTGVGGPGHEEGKPPGTVWLAVVGPDHEHAEIRQFEGEPEDILAATRDRALTLVHDALGAGTARPAR